MIKKIITSTLSGVSSAATTISSACNIELVKSDNLLQNVLDADGTLIIGKLKSEDCNPIIKIIAETKGVLLTNPESIDSLINWVKTNKISILNIVGDRNRENRYELYEYMIALLHSLINHMQPSIGRTYSLYMDEDSTYAVEGIAECDRTGKSMVVYRNSQDRILKVTPKDFFLSLIASGKTEHGENVYYQRYRPLTTR